MTQDEIIAAQNLRHELHANPELSGEEVQTAKRLREQLKSTKPDLILSGIGGHGFVAVYDSGRPGLNLMFRSELDALPIQENSGQKYTSNTDGIGHLCGHDGHSSTLYLLGSVLGKNKPKTGSVTLLFQPAEEDGSGAAAVLADEQFNAKVKPDFCFSLHNMPGLKLGHVALADGPASCASRGMRVLLRGKTAHASMPHTGLSPMFALSELMPNLTRLGNLGPLNDYFSMITVTHALMGEPVYGVAPGDAELRFTLRTMGDAQMINLCENAEALVSSTASAHGLSFEFEYDDIFLGCENHPDASAHLRKALDDLAIPHGTQGQPMLASEDFGLFANIAPSAMFLIGAGENHPNLHNSDYDFPDALLPIGANIFLKTIGNLLG